jgi:hypothetical protein
MSVPHSSTWWQAVPNNRISESPVFHTLRGSGLSQINRRQRS